MRLFNPYTSQQKSEKSEIDVDLTTPLDIEYTLAAHGPSPLTLALTGPHMYDYGTDLIGPILDSQVQENTRLNNDLNTLSSFPPDAFLCGFSLQEVLLNVAPSPLSLRLPLLEPSAILKRIPKDTFSWSSTM
jgi:hypothetical protein